MAAPVLGQVLAPAAAQPAGAAAARGGVVVVAYSFQKRFVDHILAGLEPGMVYHMDLVLIGWSPGDPA